MLDDEFTCLFGSIGGNYFAFGYCENLIKPNNLKEEKNISVFC